MSSETEVDHLVLEHLRGIRGDVAKLGLKIDLRPIVFMMGKNERIF